MITIPVSSPNSGANPYTLYRAHRTDDLAIRTAILARYAIAVPLTATEDKVVTLVPIQNIHLAHESAMASNLTPYKTANARL